MKPKINILSLLILVSLCFLFACNKSVHDFDDNFSIKTDTINNTSSVIMLSNKRLAIFRHYQSYYSSPELYYSIGLHYNPSTLNLEYFTQGINVLNLQVFPDSILLMHVAVGETEKLILKNKLIVFWLRGTDTVNRYSYNDQRQLTQVESTLSIDNYFYAEGNLVRLERHVKPPFTEYSGVNYFEYYDSIFINKQFNFIEFDPFNYIIPLIDGYSYFNLYGSTSKNLLKCIKSKSTITNAKDSICYRYNWVINDKMIKELNVEQNDTIVQKVFFDSYYN